MKIVFDLDGTLADVTHRLHYIKREAPDWDAFYNACWEDEPIAPMVELFDRLMIDYGHEIHVWTGRPERARELTLLWLRAHTKIDAADSRGIEALLMRGNKDWRPDVEVKADYLRTTQMTPDLVFEDRSQVVRMYRERGIRVAQVAEGNY